MAFSMLSIISAYSLNESSRNPECRAGAEAAPAAAAGDGGFSPPTVGVKDAAPAFKPLDVMFSALFVTILMDAIWWLFNV